MITVIRANKTSEFGLAYASEAIVVDKHDCLVFLIDGKVNWKKPKFVKGVTNEEKGYYNFNP